MKEKNNYEIENVKSFILSGKAYFTMENVQTKNHMTFRVTKCEDKENMYFVGVCNTYDGYMFIGNLYVNKELTDFTFVKSKKLIQSEKQLSVIAFEFIINRYLKVDNPLKQMKFYHHGICCKCGRKLTTPESIKLGIGPYCASIG